MSEERIAALRKRVHREDEPPVPTTEVVNPAKARKPRQRDRQSFYLDKALVKRMDETYKAMNHAIYPQACGKSDFLEAIIEFGLKHEAELRAMLTTN